MIYYRHRRSSCCRYRRSSCYHHRSSCCHHHMWGMGQVNSKCSMATFDLWTKKSGWKYDPCDCRPYEARSEWKEESHGGPYYSHHVSSGHVVVHRGIPGKGHRDGGGQRKGKKAQEGWEMDHLHDLKEWKLKDCGCQEMYVSNKQIDIILLSEGVPCNGLCRRG